MAFSFLKIPKNNQPYYILHILNIKTLTVSFDIDFSKYNKKTKQHKFILIYYYI